MRTLIIVAALNWSSAAFAQTDDVACQLEEIKPKGFPKWAEVEFEVAPEFISNRPFRSDFGESDQTEVTATATVRQCLGQRFGIKVWGGPSATLDDDHDAEAESELPIAVELQWFALGRVVPLVSYGTTAHYEGFFGGKVGDEQFVEAGARLRGDEAWNEEGWNFWTRHGRKIRLKGRAVLRWVDADPELKGDYKGGFAAFELAVPFKGKRIKVSAAVTGEFRRFDRADIIAGYKRREKFLTVFAGVDLAGLIGSWLPLPFLRQARIGVTWDKRWSNIDGDETKLRLQPGFAFGLPFE